MEKKSLVYELSSERRAARVEKQARELSSYSIFVFGVVCTRDRFQSFDGGSVVPRWIRSSEIRLPPLETPRLLVTPRVSLSLSPFLCLPTRLLMYARLLLTCIQMRARGACGISRVAGSVAGESYTLAYVNARISRIPYS